MDEALRAKDKAVSARTEAKCSKEKAEEEAYDLGVAETQAILKAQVPGVCRPEQSLTLLINKIS